MTARRRSIAHPRRPGKGAQVTRVIATQHDQKRKPNPADARTLRCSRRPRQGHGPPTPVETRGSRLSHGSPPVLAVDSRAESSRPEGGRADPVAHSEKPPGRSSSPSRRPSARLRIPVSPAPRPPSRGAPARRAGTLTREGEAAITKFRPRHCSRQDMHPLILLEKCSNTRQLRSTEVLRLGGTNEMC